ncbi:protein SOGA3 isoform X5 [Cuculus canorus]|uniref:protein SOGA3 isoform X5 n=1 Tax=Cuculus canorus TaxID=55661 RepID=UPI00051B61F1|nr:protein SOGA3 isoform X5 [Cuculus canorus]XP_053918842.1 protein SOGA3 isoform X5 [Cuculus canorus]
MDLRKQLENTERNWNKEKMELLERFDNERKEWECQWKVMQKKIEELYQEVKLRRETNMNVHDNKAIQSKMLQLSIHSPTSEESDTVELNYQHNVANDRMEKGGLLGKTGHKCKETRAKTRNNTLLMDSLTFENCEEPEDSLSIKTSKKNAKNYIGDLNVALKELARVSEELCSYQEEIRKKSNHRRMKSLPFLGEFEENKNTVILPEVNHVSSNESQTSDAFETEEHNNRKNLMSSTKVLKGMSYGGLTGDRGTDFRPWQKKEAPPVPPRSTSRHLTNSLSAVVQLSEAPLRDPGIKSNCKAQDYGSGRKQMNPSPINQNENTAACTNEGQSVKGPVMVTAAVPVIKNERNVPTHFCHNTWAYDVGKLGKDLEKGKSEPSIQSAQKSCSDGNMAQSNKMHQKQNPKSHSSPYCSNNFYAPRTLHNDLLGDSRYTLEKTRRNETLAAKIDEFNRTVFHTDKCNNTLQENQVPQTASEDHKPCGPMCESAISRTETVNTSCVSNPKFSVAKEQETSNLSKAVRTVGQQKQINGLPNTSGYRHMLHEHDWRPSNLSGRPRSADSRSNYGVVEKLLKNYEKSTVTSPCNAKACKDKWTWANSEFTDGGCETLSQYLEMLQIEQGKQEFPRNSARQIGQQLKQGKETKKLPEISVPAKCSSGKGFSRPARPANRRLPSRWASRSPSAPPAVRRTAYNCSVSFRSETSVV